MRQLQQSHSTHSQGTTKEEDKRKKKKKNRSTKKQRYQERTRGQDCQGKRHIPYCSSPSPCASRWRGQSQQRHQQQQPRPDGQMLFKANKRLHARQDTTFPRFVHKKKQKSRFLLINQPPVFARLPHDTPLTENTNSTNNKRCGSFCSCYSSSFKRVVMTPGVK